MNKKIVSVLLAVLCFAPFVLADTTTAQITEPLTKIYDLVKAVVSIIALIALTYAGARFMTSGDNTQARDGAKNMVAYCIAGLVMVWIAPLVVSFLSGP